LYKDFKFVLVIISVCSKQKKTSSIIKHSVMQKEVVAILKSVAIVVAGVLVANMIEKRLLASKTMMPREAAPVVPAAK
jgi:hypothetical protein